MPTIWERHKKTWNTKPLLREIYESWYARIVTDLVPGKTLEVGSGTGNFKDYFPKVITSDVEKISGIDKQLDAHKLPFASGSLGNIVMVDTLHHLADPIAALGEMARVLKRGGRVIMVEPFPSPISLLVYRKFHKEPFIFDRDYFQAVMNRKKTAWDANQAIPYLIFFKHVDSFSHEFGSKFKILTREKFSFILCPLTGGFDGPQLIPNQLVPATKWLERVVTPLKVFLAFRCYIVVERI